MAQLWLAPKDEVDTDELVELFASYGFEVDIDDGVAEEEAE